MPADSNPYSDPITADEAARRYNNRDLARFHFYNEAGIMADWRKLSDRLVAFGRGYLAYGDTGYYYSHLSKLAAAQRVDRCDLQATLSGIRRTIERGEQFLRDEGAR